MVGSEKEWEAESCDFQDKLEREFAGMARLNCLYRLCYYLVGLIDLIFGSYGFDGSEEGRLLGS